MYLFLTDKCLCLNDTIYMYNISYNTMYLCKQDDISNRRIIPYLITYENWSNIFLYYCSATVRLRCSIINNIYNPLKAIRTFSTNLHLAIVREEMILSHYWVGDMTLCTNWFNFNLRLYNCFSLNLTAAYVGYWILWSEIFTMSTH